ncbi:7-cyano-7-deazaguanine synthase QueC [Pacificimonas flava]|uniref:7-cyano-7-deazaguanine synthase n=2 Tax=Pacificimonas TaxID=1960290 RepID=A0A219B662_9SPHN|nr:MULTISPECIES: 7-cyano-7-deazaguanine synthase QueC [Pacificimonas]MBZ6379126.1 7-cyano-7-deazaguanine synthase QueC [Pacificimonas aurantium]OWV33643.1 7-cyano-7-deazaguanine synthase QueC [Pacificimonas flava]
MTRQAVVLLSGGLDSTTCAAQARADGFELLALTIDYNQRHRVELDAAARAAERFEARRHVVLPLDLSAFGGSALTSDMEVPKGEGEVDDSQIPSTYVPARNTVFLSVALAFAEASRARDIYIGVNALDYSGYPDCRPAFIKAFEDLAAQATKAGTEGDRFQVHTPLIDLDKAGIATLARQLGVDAGETWTCYDPVEKGGQVLHCGRCDACRLRHKGFVEAGLPDPTAYA